MVTPNQEVKEKQKISLKKIVVVVLLACLSAAAAGLVVQKIETKVSKDKINNYVCEVVDSDPDVGILAMRCMVKDGE